MQSAVMRRMFVPLMSVVLWAIPTVEGAQKVVPHGPCFDNANRYVDCGNGTVTDTVTGLIWLKQHDCLADNDWAAANQAAAGLRNGDCDLTDKSSPGDWRLPTKDEWSATMAPAAALGCRRPVGEPPTLTNDAGTACYGTGVGSSFANVGPFHYWSSTALETSGAHGWVAGLDEGTLGIADKFGSFRVWPVRAGSR